MLAGSQKQKLEAKGTAARLEEFTPLSSNFAIIREIPICTSPIAGFMIECPALPLLAHQHPFHRTHIAP